MPLPIRFDIVDKDQRVVTVGVNQKPTEYVPDPEYHPTMILVRCSNCKNVGIAEFMNGFNFKDGDRLMDKKPIRGSCLKCQKDVELIPVPDLTEEESKQYNALYNIQRALAHAAKEGHRINSNSIILPLARQEMYRKWLEEANNGGK